MTDGAPCLHDGEPPLEQRLGLVGQQVVHAFSGRPVRIVVVHAPGRTLEPFRPADFLVAVTHRVIEDVDTRRTGASFRDLLHGRVVDSPDAFLVQEVDRR